MIEEVIVRQWTCLITLLISLTACGLKISHDQVYKEDSRQFHSINPAFDTYIESFEEEARIMYLNDNFVIGDIPINFGDTENVQFQGVCFLYPNGDREVIVRKEWWDAVTEIKKETLIFHELGHCKLDRDHRNDSITHQSVIYQLSVMHENILNADQFSDYRPEYITELFGQNSAALEAAITQEE